MLDVRQGELCWVVGTVFMELPLKPNVLEDIAKEVFLEMAMIPRHNDAQAADTVP